MAAVGGSTMIAGCSNGGGGDTTTTTSSDGTTDDGTTSGGSGRIDRTFRIIPGGFNPPDMQFNYLNAKNWADPVDEWLFDRFVWYMPLADEYRGAVFTDWSVDGKTLTATVDEAQTWHDGDDVTAEDVAGHWTLMIGQQVLAQDEHPYFASVEATGDYTVEFTLHEAFNADLVVQSQFAADSGRLYLKPSLFEGRVEQVQTAIENNNKEELQSIYTDLQQKTIANPTGSNYCKQKKSVSQYYHTETFDDYAREENINWTETRFIARGSQQGMMNEITSGNVDATPYFSLQPQAIMNQWPENRILVEVPSFGGRTTTFNTQRIDRPLRRALAWVINPQGILDGTPRNLNTISQPSCGIYQEGVERWLGDTASGFHSYNHSTDRATQILQDAGYSKQDGSWVNPDGEPVSIEYLTPPWSDTAVPVAQVAVDNMNSFGIDANVSVKDGATWNSRITSQDFDVTLTGWGGSPHPFFTLEDAFQGFHGSICGISTELEVPPVGEWNGSTSTMNVGEILTNLRTIQDPEKMKTGIQKVAWALNYHMPIYFAVEGFSSAHLHFPDRFDFTTDDPNIRQNANPIVDLPRYGQLQAME